MPRPLPADLPMLAGAALASTAAPAIAAPREPVRPTLVLSDLEVPPPDDGIRAMVATAVASDDPDTVATIVAVAKRTAPGRAGEIDEMVAGYRARLTASAEVKRRADLAVEQAQRDYLATAGFLSLWSGQVEAGGSWSTGNTRAFGLYGNARLRREGLDWQNDFTARIDYQRTNDRTSTERVVAAFQPRYKVNPSRYAYGLAQYEHDRFLGYDHRFTGGVGAGVVAVDKSGLRVEFDAGPAFRFTRYYDQPDESRIAGRGGLTLRWLPWPTATVRQEATLYLQKGATTASSTTALDTLLFGPVKARLSYNVQYESDQPGGQKDTDAVSRASIVYSF